MSVKDCAKVKKNVIVYFKKFARKNYNEKSLENLKQIQEKRHSNNKFLQILKKQSYVECINTYTKNYRTAYESVTEKKIKTCFSPQQSSKISEITNVFIQSLLSGYQRKRGLAQRSVSFVTLTLPSQQMHTDKEIIRSLTRFLDHIKKVKNYVVENGQNSKFELLPVENYIWRAETQENGNIHFHILFDTYFSMVTLKNVWNLQLQKLGYINGEKSASIHAIKNLNDVGSYVTKYMTKEPLNDMHNNEKRLKIGLPPLSKNELEKIPDEQKYRRPVIGKSWGCSKALLKISYPVFEENRLVELNDLISKMQEVPKEHLKKSVPDFIRIYKGSILKIVNQFGLKIKKTLNNYYKYIYNYMYDYDKFYNQNNMLESIRFYEDIKNGKSDFYFPKKIEKTIENIKQKIKQTSRQMSFEIDYYSSKPKYI